MSQNSFPPKEIVYSMNNQRSFFKQFITVCSLFFWSTVLCAQQFADPCFLSSEPSTVFESTDVLYNVWNSDLMEWNGEAWLGAWEHANITITPPSGQVGCRALFLGNGITWTDDGETVAFRLEEPLVTGSQYKFTFTTVSHGEGSDGSFAPHLYTSSISYWEDDTTYLGDIGPVGNSWETTAIEFTASSIQQGHSWVIVHSGLGSSGMVSSFCNTCMLCEEQEVLEDYAEQCEGDVLELTVFDEGAVAYKWGDGSTEAIFEVSESGVYSVNVLTEDCTQLDTIGVKFYEEPFTNLGIDGNLCPGQSILLDVYSEDASYLWQDNSNSSSFEVTEPGNYWVTVTNLCGEVSDSVRYECEEIVVPNVFSPNGDGRNDVFEPNLTDGIDFLTLEVFNRWGEEVFKQANAHPAWDGNYNGEACSEGVYYWIASFYDINGIRQVSSGDVTLLR